MMAGRQLRAAKKIAHSTWHDTIDEHLDAIAEELAEDAGDSRGGKDKKEIAAAIDDAFNALSRPPSYYEVLICRDGSRASDNLQPIAQEINRVQPKARFDEPSLDNWMEQGVLALPTSLAPTRMRSWEGLLRALAARWAELVEDPTVFAWGKRANKLCAGLPVEIHEGPPSRVHFDMFEIDWGTSCKFLEIYTDGSAWGPPLPKGGMDSDAPSARAGGGVYIRWHYDDQVSEREVMVKVRGRQTAQRAELYAMKSALRFLARVRWRKAIIYSDSLYAINQASGAWKTNTNHDLVLKTQDAYEAASARGRVKLVHVRGHQKDKRKELHAGNNRADAIAERASAHYA